MEPNGGSFRLRRGEVTRTYCAPVLFNALSPSAQDSEDPPDVVSAERFTAWLLEAKPHIIRPIRALQ
jgi:hypothetical protein